MFHTIMPVLIGFGSIWIRFLMSERANFQLPHPERFIAGSVVLAAAFGGINGVAEETAMARDRGELEYYGTMPVSRASVLSAIISLPIIYALPGLATMVATGSLLLGVKATIGLGSVLAGFNLILLMASIGLLLGFWLPWRTAALVSKVLPLLLFTATPLVVQPDVLPKPLGWLGRHLPTTFAADVFERATYGTGPNAPIARSVAVAAVSVILIAIVVKLAGWRRSQ
jgi:ABC-2 type transport system permease protein